jgi:hypothetical protein
MIAHETHAFLGRDGLLVAGSMPRATISASTVSTG